MQSVKTEKSAEISLEAEDKDQMGRKKKSKPQDPEQYAAFVEMAEQIQAEDADERFEDAMRRIISAKKPKAEARTNAEK